MQKLIIILFVVTLLMPVSVTPVLADVDGVSQAGCGESDNSGAKNEHSRDAQNAGPDGQGRPEAPIPKKASNGRHQGKAGDGDPDCDVRPDGS